jgi:all-trans-retinol 13,14-reductase
MNDVSKFVQAAPFGGNRSWDGRVTLKFDRWDTIIVGAGIGGLTAAAKLVGAGRRVLVLDRNPHPGGTAYAFHRKSFSFPMGPLGFSSPEIVKNILQEFGYGEGFGFDRIHFRLKAFNLSLPLSLSYDEMVNTLSSHFPSEKDSVAAFFREIERLSTLPETNTTAVGHPHPQGWAGRPVAEYLHGIIRDWRLRRILGSLGTREPYSSFALQAAMWNLMIKNGIWYPKGGMRSFAERLVQAIEGGPKRGNGLVRLRTEVRGIRVKARSVLGVTLRDGTDIDACSVISNADYKTTFLRLLDRNTVPDPWYQAVSDAKQTGSVLQVCLGVDKGRVDLSPFVGGSRVIYRRDQGDIFEEAEPDWKAEEIDPEILAAQELEVSLWNKEDRKLAPDGGDVIVIRTEAPYTHFARYRIGYRKRVPAYFDYKMKLGRALIREIRGLIPGLEDAIIVMDVATPLTFEDQGGRSEGAVAGWSWDYEDFHDWQPRELVRTPIRGLYMAGYQAFTALFAGGVPTAMESGMRAAEAVLQGADPVEEVIIPWRM